MLLILNPFSLLRRLARCRGMLQRECEEYRLLGETERVVKEAIKYAVKRMKAAKYRISEADVPKLYYKCMKMLTTGLSEETLMSREYLTYLEFYKFFKKRVEERAWPLIWKLFEIRGVKVRKIIIADRMGGEGITESRAYMGRDIDCMVVVDTQDLERAKEEAIRIEEMINQTVGNKLQKILIDNGKANEKELKKCKFYDLFEIEVFDDEEKAKRWGSILELSRRDFLREMAKKTLLFY